VVVAGGVVWCDQKEEKLNGEAGKSAACMYVIERCGYYILLRLLQAGCNTPVGIQAPVEIVAYATPQEVVNKEVLPLTVQALIGASPFTNTQCLMHLLLPNESPVLFVRGYHTIRAFKKGIHTTHNTWAIDMDGVYDTAVPFG